MVPKVINRLRSFARHCQKLLNTGNILYQKSWSSRREGRTWKVKTHLFPARRDRRINMTHDTHTHVHTGKSELQCGTTVQHCLSVRFFPTFSHYSINETSREADFFLFFFFERVYDYCSSSPLNEETSG